MRPGFPVTVGRRTLFSTTARVSVERW